MPRSDFNGDGRSDILWRHVSGTYSNWLGSPTGGFIINDANAQGFETPIYRATSGIGDFNGDGYADVLWRGAVSLGRSRISADLGTESGGFDGTTTTLQISSFTKLVGIGDFNHDGRDDILLKLGASTSYALYFAYEDGHFAAGSRLSLSAPLDWKVAGIGDFNGDGYADILWRNDDGRLSDWLGGASGFAVNDAAALTNVPIDWQVESTGDFDGDGRDDILWRNATGAISNWLGTAAGGFTVNDANALRQVPLDWSVAGVGDYNGDGHDDILWRNASGTISDWLGTDGGGFIVNDAQALTSVSVDWTVQSMESLSSGSVWPWFDPFI